MYILETIKSSVVLCGFLVCFAYHWAFAGAEFDHFVTGNPADVTKPTSGLIVMQGGGTDVDENYVRMGTRSGGGDFVVIRASGDDDYNDYIFHLCSCDSVETLVLKNREASFDPRVIATIKNAEALWIAGGDQSRYVKFWKDTPVEDAIHSVVNKPAPIGGTSAGMAIMGEFSYPAMSDTSLTSEEALGNPFSRHVNLERNFLVLPKLHGILTDQHVKERNRIGRTIVLLARIIQNGWTLEAKAIAADRETAIHLDPETGMVEVFGTAKHPTPYVYFLRTQKPPQVCRAETPLTLKNVEVYRIGPDGKFDTVKWKGQNGISYSLSVKSGVLKSSREEVY